jgi:AAA15 family ATPase/GTPase
MDNGLHPARLYLLLQLVEQRAFQGNIQMIATSHSPQMLRGLGKRAFEDASLVYRVENTPEARIQRIVEMPAIREILEKQDLSRLHESGWFEDAMFFPDDVESAR